MKTLHPRGSGPAGMSWLLLGSPRDTTPVVFCGKGYCHRVVRRFQWLSEHDVPFTDWETACGKTGRRDSWKFQIRHNSGSGDLCKECWK